MKKLTIVINGLEYVAKDNQNNDLDNAKLRETIKIKDRQIKGLSTHIEDLQEENDGLERALSEKHEEINDLQTQIDELEDRISNIANDWNKLAHAMSQIQSILKLVG